MMPAKTPNRLEKNKIFVDFGWKWAHKTEYNDLKKWQVT